MSESPRGSVEAPRPFFLARLALALVVPTITYASLRPFTGWRDPGKRPFDDLAVPHGLGSPFDAILNVVGYVPFGACLAWALFPRLRRRWAFAVGVLVPVLYSVLVEVIQNYLPGRVSSIIDVGTNATGAFLGALLAAGFTPWLADHRGGRRWRQHWLVPGPLAEVGLLVLAAWLVAMFAQRTLLFGTGDFRGNLLMSVNPDVPTLVYLATEVFVVTANGVVVAVLLRLVLADGVPRVRWWLALVAAALGMREIAQLAFWESAAAWRWINPAGLAGLATAAVAAALAMKLSRRAAAALAVFLLVASVVVVNVTPPDPALWSQRDPPRERLLIGLTLVGRYAAKAWPFAALVYLLLVLRRARTRR